LQVVFTGAAYKSCLARQAFVAELDKMRLLSKPTAHYLQAFDKVRGGGSPTHTLECASRGPLTDRASCGLPRVVHGQHNTLVAIGCTLQAADAWGVEGVFLDNKNIPLLPLKPLDLLPNAVYMRTSKEKVVKGKAASGKRGHGASWQEAGGGEDDTEWEEWELLPIFSKPDKSYEWDSEPFSAEHPEMLVMMCMVSLVASRVDGMISQLTDDPHALLLPQEAEERYEEEISEGGTRISYRPVKIFNHIHSLKLPELLTKRKHNPRVKVIVRYIGGDKLGIRTLPICGGANGCKRQATHENQEGDKLLCCEMVRCSLSTFH
jgi:hypothetical protein